MHSVLPIAIPVVSISKVIMDEAACENLNVLNLTLVVTAAMGTLYAKGARYKLSKIHNLPCPKTAIGIQESVHQVET